jgi:drug/metabolite transporter (DMT)-like permease
MSRRDLFDLILLGAIWGAAFLFTRVAVPSFGPVALVEVRVTIAAAMLLALLVARGQLGELRGRWKALTIIALLNTAVPFALFAYATRTVPAGFAAVLNSTVPLFGALVGRAFFGEKLGGTRAVGLAIGFGGVLALVAPRLQVAGSPLAIAAALSASMMYAIAAHLTRRIAPGVSAVVLSAGSLLASVAILAVPAVILWPETMPSSGAWMATLALAVFCTGIAYILYFRLLARVGAAGAVAVTYLIPLFGMIWGGIFLSEHLTLPMLAGCALILLGVSVTTGAIHVLRPTQTSAP